MKSCKRGAARCAAWDNGSGVLHIRHIRLRLPASSEVQMMLTDDAVLRLLFYWTLHTIIRTVVTATAVSCLAQGGMETAVGWRGLTLRLPPSAATLGTTKHPPASSCSARLNSSASTNRYGTQPSNTYMTLAAGSKSYHSASPSRKVTLALTCPARSGLSAARPVPLRAGATPRSVTVP